MIHQFSICLEHLWVILLHFLWIHYTGKYSSSGIKPIERLDIFHISCNANPNLPMGVKGPRNKTIQLKDGEEIRHTNLYPIASCPDRFIEANPHQLLFKIFQDIQRQILPPWLLSRMYPAGNPKISHRVVALNLNELVRNVWAIARFSPTGRSCPNLPGCMPRTALGDPQRL